MNEVTRLQTLHSYQILDTPPEKDFDDLVRLAAQICATPIATVTLVDAHRQWFKSHLGLKLQEAPLTAAFCVETIQGKRPLIVTDAQQDPRFAANPWVVGAPYVRFYMGVPLLNGEGVPLGTLTVMDTEPRQLTALQLNSVQVLADQVMNQFELRVLAQRQIAVRAAHERVESELRESERRFARLFSSAATGITLSYPHGEIIQANPAFCATVGYAEAELMGMDYAALLHAEDRSQFEAELRQLLDGTIEHFVQELRYVQQGGAPVWVRASMSCVHTELGEPQHVISVTEDITARVQAQAIATGLQERLATTLERMTDAFCILDLDWRIAYLNKEAERLILHTTEEVQNLTLWDRFPPTASSKLYDEFHRAMRERSPAHFDLYYPPLQNWFEVHAYPVPDGLAIYFRVITDRIQAQEALRASEERFRQLAETIDDVFWIWDPHADRMIYASPRYEDVFCQSREDLYRDSRSFARNIHPDDRRRLVEAVQADPYSIKMAYRLLLDDGATRWVDVRTFPVYDENGKVIHSVGIAHDITQLREAAARLQASEEQYRLLFSQNPHPMFVIELETLRFLAVNRRALEQYGYSEEEFLNMTMVDMRPIDDVQRLLQVIANARGPVEVSYWRHRKKDGTIIDVEVASDEIEFNGRRARLALATDITTRKRAEEQVQRQAALLDKAQDAIMVCDLDLRINYWNNGAERVYGWRTDEVLGATTRELLHRDPAQFDRAHQQLLAHGEWFGELQQVDRQGRELLVEVRWTLVQDAHGVAEAVLSINTDITERRKLEAQFLRSQRMESIGTLAGGIAHDLNNVLAPILLSLGMLKRQSKTPAEQKLIATLENSAQRGANMVRQVLTFARGVDSERVVVNVGEIVHDLENLIRDTFDRSIRFTVSVDEGLPTILGDPTQLHQVILNLCVNARDAITHGGDLTLSASSTYLESPFASMDLVAEPGTYVVLVVADTGMGIAPEIRDRIFDPFFTTKEVGKGTGLGLPTVQAVVKSHGGFINVYSEEGRGTEFKIYLPAHSAAVTGEPATLMMQPSTSDGEMLLVIDDEPAIRMITQQTLESFGYRVLLADGGAAAIALYNQYQDEIAVVLTDMMMPEMDGLAIVQALRRLNPDVEVIAASGLADSETVAKATEAGITHFLQKPYTTESLLRVLAEIRQAKQTTDG